MNATTSWEEMKARFSGRRDLRLDLGCGEVKHPDCIGLDVRPLSGVDCVLDMERQPLPFDDRSVSYIYSSHFLEHTTRLDAVLAEISRVCADGAQLELWTPYSWHSHGLLPGHTTFFMEEYYYFVCVYYREAWQKLVGVDAHWVLNGIHYSISEETQALLRQRNIELEFALKHMINIASEFCAYITVWHSPPPEPYPPFKVTYSNGRGGERHALAEMEIVTTSPPSLRPKPRREVS